MNGQKTVCSHNSHKSITRAKEACVQISYNVHFQWDACAVIHCVGVIINSNVLSVYCVHGMGGVSALSENPHV